MNRYIVDFRMNSDTFTLIAEGRTKNEVKIDIVRKCVVEHGVLPKHFHVYDLELNKKFQFKIEFGTPYKKRTRNSSNHGGRRVVNPIHTYDIETMEYVGSYESAREFSEDVGVPITTLGNKLAQYPNGFRYGFMWCTRKKMKQKGD